MLQIILILETRSSCESDFRYIKSALDYFYVERTYKLSKIFAKTKPELIKADKKISEFKNKYKGKSVVVICADYDRNDDPVNNKIISYCKKNDYELVWMNLDVEEVFWGKQISNRQKNKESLRFLTLKNTILSKIKDLNIIKPLKKHPASNLLVVMDKHLIRKT